MSRVVVCEFILEIPLLLVHPSMNVRYSLTLFIPVV
jgi:hypothetical protein